MNKITIFILLLLITACSRHQNGSDFKNPPQSAGVHTWWHWLDGAITREGITRDLEAMQKQGITEATIFNIGLYGGKDFGVPQVKFDTPEWYEMFYWALQEADRLDIKIGAHNCDGWSTSGGPWITPEKSMKQYVWSISSAKGGQSVEINLIQPKTEHNFYQDVAVIAYKSTSPANSFQLANPIVVLNDTTDASALIDGSPVSYIKVKPGNKILFSFDKPFSAVKIAIHPHQAFIWNDMSKVTAKYALYISQDGKSFRKINEFETRGLNRTFIFGFPMVEARYYRVELISVAYFRAEDNFMLSEMELINIADHPTYNPGIPFHLEKTVSVKASDVGCFDSTSSHNTGIINENEIINLTGRMKPDGRLQWDAPEGNWTIIRFGFTTTGTVNGPATAEGIGLECDKMDTSALNLHFRSYPQKLIEKAGKYAGNTFKFLLIDSWECKYQNWTASFVNEFEKRRGYSIINFIPVLCGETVGNSEVSEAFLYDFRKTIAELIETNYYKHYGDLCHQNKLEYHAEAIYGNTGYPPLDILKSNSYIDLPMYEFWADINAQSFIAYRPSARPEACFPYAASVVYDKPVLGAEAYTGFVHYSESPDVLKPYGDRAFCMGINQLILHSNVHQPFEKTPGMTLGPFAAHFNRHTPWWQHASAWIDYQSRIQYMLQNVKTIVDVLYYAGDQLPQQIDNQAVNSLPFGFNAVACNLNVLANKITVENGQLVLSDHQRFCMLILPGNPGMELSTLQRIEQLVTEGAVVYGPKPQKMLSLKNVKENRTVFDSLVEKLWGTNDNKNENTCGKGLVIWSVPVAQALDRINAVPDFKTNVSDSLNLMYIHKKSGNTDIYFVFNQQDIPLHRECRFRISGKKPEIWNPEDGSVSKPAIYTFENSQTLIPFTFAPHQASIFVFDETASDNHIVRVTMDGRQIFPLISNETETAVPYVTYSEKGFKAITDNDGEYTFIDARNKETKIKLSKPEELEIRNFKGTIEFKPSYKADIKPAEITNLTPLNAYEQADIKYFSGSARYTIQFDVPANFVTGESKVMLNLGEIGSTAEVALNGKPLGIAWKSGTSFETDGLKQTGNTLEITIATVFRNRIIGDLQEYGVLKNIWTSGPVEQFLNKDSKLKPSGLIGPLKLVKVDEKN